MPRPGRTLYMDVLLLLVVQVLLVLPTVLGVRASWGVHTLHGVTPWPDAQQQAGVVANVHVSHPGQSGHNVPAKTPTKTDLTSAAQTYARYEHFDARTPQQPVSMYQEFRLQQHHPPSAHYATPPDAVTDTTTFSPTYYSEHVTVRSPPPQQPPPQPYTPSTETAYSAAPSSRHPTAAKSLQLPGGSDLHHEIQMHLSQQIQVQLQQLQKLHELQTKMLHKTPKPVDTPATPAPPSAQAVQQGSENVNTQVLHPNHAAPQHLQQHPQHQQHYSTPGPVVYASPMTTPAPPPPLTEPRYPEESQPLTSFIGEPPSPSVGGAISNGFQPILSPAGRHPDAQHPHQDVAGGHDFQPFTEDATDPALPFYLLPPAEDSDSQFNRLRDAAHNEANLGDPDAPSAPEASSSERDVIEQPYRHSARGKHRLRPSRGKRPAVVPGPGGVSQSARKHCGTWGGVAAAPGPSAAPAPCRLLASRHPHHPAYHHPRLPGTRFPPTGAETTAAGSALRLRIASPMIRFRDPVDPRAPLTLMARHPGPPGRPPVTVMHAVQRIRVIKKRP